MNDSSLLHRRKSDRIKIIFFYFSFVKQRNSKNINYCGLVEINEKYKIFAELENKDLESSYKRAQSTTFIQTFFFPKFLEPNPPEVREHEQLCPQARAGRAGREKGAVPTIVQFDDERVIHFHQDVPLHLGTDSVPN